MKALFVLTIIFGLFAARAQAQDSCMSDVAKILTSPAARRHLSEEIAQKAQSAVGRSLSEKEEKAIRDALKVSADDIYTASEVAKQDRLLVKAGFKQDEIDKLRAKGVLGHSVISLANGAPRGVAIQAIDLHPMNNQSLRALKKGENLHYVVGENGSMYVTTEKLALPEDKIVIAVRNKLGDLGKEGSDFGLVVREAGELEFDAAANSFSFKPKYGFDTSELEVKEIVSNVSAFNPGARVTYTASPAIPQSRVVKCLDILSAQTSGKNFVLDRMISDNLVTVTAIAGSELAGAGRLQTDSGRRVIAADVVGGNVNGLLGAYIGKHLVIKDANFMTSMAIRTGMGLGMIEIQKQVHKSFVDEQSQQAAEDIAAFNRAHFFARLPVNHYFDQFMVKKLPNMIFNACQRRPLTSVLVSPRSIRLYERYGSTVLYYGLRNSIVGQ